MRVRRREGGRRGDGKEGGWVERKRGRGREKGDKRGIEEGMGEKSMTEMGVGKHKFILTLLRLLRYPNSISKQ